MTTFDLLAENREAAAFEKFENVSYRLVVNRPSKIEDAPELK